VKLHKKNMSSKDKDIPLDVIYQKIEKMEEDNECSVHLEEEESSVKREQSEDCCEKKAKKKKKRGCMRRWCTCCGVLTSIAIVIYAIFVLIFSLQTYLSLHQCFDSKENVLKEETFHISHIRNIHFDIVSGFVEVYFHNASTIDVKLWDKSRSALHRDAHTFDSGIKAINSTLNIYSYSPAFNFKSCHHASVEIYIPNAHRRVFSLSGNVKLGSVQIEGTMYSYPGKRSFSNIDITVEMGTIDVNHAILSDSLTLKTDFGSIDVSDIFVNQTVKLQTHTGSISSSLVETKNFNAITQIGCSIHRSLMADTMNVDTKFGYSNVKFPEHLGKEGHISISTEYGKSKLIMGALVNTDFDVSTTKGKETVKNEKCIFYLPIAMSPNYGLCNITEENAKFSKVVMKTTYGNAELVLP